MYYGEAHTALDEKGRLAMPIQFRRLIEALDHDTWFITRGFDRCLFLFHKAQWEALLSKIPGGTLDPRTMNFRRFFIGGAAKVKVDRQSRLLVPQYLREYASVDRDGVLLGLEDHLELWSESGWREHQSSSLPEYKQMAAELFGTNRTGTAQPMEEPQHVDS